MNDLALLLDLFGNSEETKLLICAAIFVWCLQRHRNRGLNSGQKSAIIVTDACAPLLADIFLYAYEAEFIESLLSTRKKKLASQFNFTYRYIDDVLSINNPYFENYLGQMYRTKLEIKDTTESNTSASYLDLLLSIGRDGQLRTSLYDKHGDFNFQITNFPFLSSNTPSSPTYGVFISQVIRYTMACSSYECFYSKGGATFI